jgi:uncharacterized protein YbjT (DUF2867 family)
MSSLILLTGASGYVGGRLLNRFESEGRRVRCLSRHPVFLEPRVGEQTEVLHGDLLDRESLHGVFDDIDTAYYLVHSMADAEHFEEKERTSARNFADAAHAAGVRRIIYLGGLGHGSELSPHLETRQEVGRILRDSGVPTIELRASVIIGSGSLSFEMVRALVEKLPVMFTPRWVSARAQPIGIDDVLDYLVAALEIPLTGSVVYEIGGTDAISYRGIMEEYARQRGLKRWMIPVPVLTPRLSSLWLGLVTPIYARIGRKLIEGVRNETVVRDQRALEDFNVRPQGIRESIRRALSNEDRDFAATRWSDAVSSKGPLRTLEGVRFGSRIVDSRSTEVDLPPATAFGAVRRIGGVTGWYYGKSLWKLRGYLDLLMGGPGLRRGRRDPEQLVPGDAVDFWRVEVIEPDRLLRLRAEMRLPGRAWLQFEVEPTERGSLIRQTALFDPVGLFGQLYWYALYPLHHLVFDGMLQGLARAAARQS